MEKNRLEKVRKHVFYKHMNIVTKNGGKTRENFFPETHSFRKQTTMEKIVWKKCENTFFINTRISWPKNWGKTREKIFFPNTHVYREIKTMEKNRLGKSAKTRFFMKTRISWPKNGGGKNARKIFSTNTPI